MTHRISRIADALHLLMSAPRTAKDLVDLANIGPKAVNEWIAMLSADKRISLCGTRRNGRRGKAAYLWRWNERRVDPLPVGAPVPAPAGLADDAAGHADQEDDNGP